MHTKQILRQFLVLALALGGTVAVYADNYHGHHGRAEMHYDGRYNHNHSYPAHGYVYNSLPYGYSSVHYHGSPYYCTVWFGGAPYYDADQTYYQWYPERRQYVVTHPPEEHQPDSSAPASSAEDVFVYPK